MKLDIVALPYPFLSWLWQYQYHRMEAGLLSHTSAYNKANHICKATRQFPERYKIWNIHSYFPLVCEYDCESFLLISTAFQKDIQLTCGITTRTWKARPKMKENHDNEEPVILWTGHIPCKGPSPCCYINKVEISWVRQEISVNFLAFFLLEFRNTLNIKRCWTYKCCVDFIMTVCAGKLIPWARVFVVQITWISPLRKRLSMRLRSFKQSPPLW